MNDSIEKRESSIYVISLYITGGVQIIIEWITAISFRRY